MINIHPVEQDTLWPLHQKEDMGTQLIAGKTLSELQYELTPDDKKFHLHANAWVSAADWEKLVTAPSDASLKTDDDELMAWSGEYDAKNTSITASADSFLIRYPWEFLKINEQLVSLLSENKIIGEVSPAAHVDGFISVGKGSRILPGVVIEGNVVIGKNCKIGPNCYLRGSTSIGDDCHIGQSVEVKNSIIGNGSSVGHLSYVGDSVIGTNVNFGAGTMTSNLRHDGTNHRSVVQGKLRDTGRRKLGCIIGNDVHTGVLTAIYPGRKLAPHATTLPNGTVDQDIL